MARTSVLRRSCPNRACELRGTSGEGNITKHGFLKVKFGRRRRYRCTACGITFGINTGTTYHFMRPHSSLKFGKEVRTPAIQAGLATKQLSFRDVFLSSRQIRGSNVLLMVIGGGVDRELEQSRAA